MEHFPLVPLHPHSAKSEKSRLRHSTWQVLGQNISKLPRSKYGDPSQPQSMKTGSTAPCKRL